MAGTVDVLSGTVTVRAIEDLTVGQRRGLQMRLLLLGVNRFRQVVTARGATTEDLAVEIGLTDTEALQVQAISDATVLALIESWTLPWPIPTTIPALAALPAGVRAAVEDVTAAEGARLIEALVT